MTSMGTGSAILARHDENATPKSRAKVQGDTWMYVRVILQTLSDGVVE